MKSAWHGTHQYNLAKNYVGRRISRRPTINCASRVQWLRVFTVVYSISVIISLNTSMVTVRADGMIATAPSPNGTRVVSSSLSNATLTPIAVTVAAIAPQPLRHADAMAVSTVSVSSPTTVVASGITPQPRQHIALKVPPTTSSVPEGTKEAVIAPQPARHIDGTIVATPLATRPATTVVTSTATSTATRTPIMGATVVATATITQPAANTIALGAYVDSAPEYDTLPEYISTVGAAPKVLMWYRNWANGPNPAFTPSDLDVAYNHGAMPMISWQPLDGEASDSQPAYSCANIVAGRYDDFITTWARAAAAYHKPFYLRLSHEMNGDWYPWGTAPSNPNGNTPAQYVAMWRHVVTIFRQQGATNVRWVWSPNAISEYSTFSSFDQNYPGDEYVDWVGIDGYNFGTTYGSGWRTITEIFGASYDALTAMTAKPLMIAEIGAAEQGGDKAAWIRQGLLTEVPQRLPRVRALIWFDVKRDIDYRVNSSSAALAAFHMVTQSPLYQGQLP